MFLSKLDSRSTIDLAVEEKIGADPVFSLKSTCEYDAPTVGLVNLGATCFLNSILQCIFADSTYRQAIFDWRPKVISNFLVHVW